MYKSNLQINKQTFNLRIKNKKKFPDNFEREKKKRKKNFEIIIFFCV